MTALDQVREFLNRKQREANAWRRALLNDKGELHSDGRLMLRSLMRSAHYFDVGYVPGDHDRTLILAVRRETVNRILKLLSFDEARALKEMREDND
jgi:hypothetical protein